MKYLRIIPLALAGLFVLASWFSACTGSNFSGGSSKSSPGKKSGDPADAEGVDANHGAERASNPVSE